MSVKTYKSIGDAIGDAMESNARMAAELWSHRQKDHNNDRKDYPDPQGK